MFQLCRNTAPVVSSRSSGSRQQMSKSSGPKEFWRGIPGTPCSSSISRWDFPVHKNHPFLGTPMTMESPKWLERTRARYQARCRLVVRWPWRAPREVPHVFSSIQLLKTTLHICNPLSEGAFKKMRQLLLQVLVMSDVSCCLVPDWDNYPVQTSMHWHSESQVLNVEVFIRSLKACFRGFEWFWSSKHKRGNDAVLVWLPSPGFCKETRNRCGFEQ